MKQITGFFVPSFYGINIRVDNRIRNNRLAPDKKHKGFMICNQKMYDMLKEHPAMKDYEFK